MDFSIFLYNRLQFNLLDIIVLSTQITSKWLDNWECIGRFTLSLFGKQSYATMLASSYMCATPGFSGDRTMPFGHITCTYSTFRTTVFSIFNSQIPSASGWLTQAILFSSPTISCLQLRTENITNTLLGCIRLVRTAFIFSCQKSTAW